MSKLHRVLFKFWEIVEKLKTDIDRLNLVSRMKKKARARERGGGGGGGGGGSGCLSL